MVASLGLCSELEVLDDYFGEWLKLKEIREKRKRKKKKPRA